MIIGSLKAFIFLLKFAVDAAKKIDTLTEEEIAEAEEVTAAVAVEVTKIDAVADSAAEEAATISAATREEKIAMATEEAAVAEILAAAAAASEVAVEAVEEDSIVVEIVTIEEGILEPL